MRLALTVEKAEVKECLEDLFDSRILGIVEHEVLKGYMVVYYEEMQIMKNQCKHLTVFENTPGMPYDCERRYRITDDIDDMIHFKNLEKCARCKYYEEEV